MAFLVKVESLYFIPINFNKKSMQQKYYLVFIHYSPSLVYYFLNLKNFSKPAGLVTVNETHLFLLIPDMHVEFHIYN